MRVRQYRLQNIIIVPAVQAAVVLNPGWRHKTKASENHWFSEAFCDLVNIVGDPVGIRTQDPQLRRLLLYPAELPDRIFSMCKISYFRVNGRRMIC